MIVECPSDVELESFVEHRSHVRGAPSGGSSILSHHVETCPRCRARMELLSKDHVLMAALADAYVVNQATLEAPPEKLAAPIGPPRIVGYEVESEIHRGGQGVVYRAVQRATKRRVALKVLLRGAGASVRQRQRFSREIDLASNLRHPNIVTIFDGGAAPDGNLYCAMEYVEGLSLDDFVRAKRATQKSDDPAAMRDALSLFAKVCAAVHHAHEHGVIHRDLKPSNIVVDAAGEPRVLDFGLAKIADPERLAQTSLMTMTGEFMGTLAYASPEQTRGDTALIDARSDVYSLGVILYEMLTGRAPYRVMGAMADALRAISEDEPVPPSSWHRGEERINVSSQFAALKVDDEVETIVLKALSKEKSRRYQTAEELRRDIERYLEGDAIEAKRDSMGYVLRKKAWKRRIGISVAMAALAFSIGYWWLWGRVEVSEKTAEKERKRADTLDRFNEKSALQHRFLLMSGMTTMLVAPPPVDSAQFDREASITIGVNPPIEILNPLYCSAGDKIVCDFLYESLFRRSKDGRLIPNEHLIEAIIEDKDPLLKVVKLREGLKWHDNQPLTADDVIFSWRQSISRGVQSSKASVLSHLEDVIRVDGRTLRFKLKKGYEGVWQVSLSIELIPKHLFETKVDEDPTLFRHAYYKNLNRNPIGCGPFRFVKWNGESVVLERWDQYESTKDIPHFRRLVVRPIAAPDAKLKALLAGEIDLTKLSPEQYKKVRFADEFTRVARESRRQSARYSSIVWNCRSELGLFNDLRVRKAMCYAINVQRLIADVIDNMATPAFGPWDTDSPYFDQNSSTFRFDRDMAKDLLVKAGWQRGADGKQFRKRLDEINGKYDVQPFEFDLIVQAQEPISMRAAELCREDLAIVGVTARIVPLDLSSFKLRQKKGEFGGCFTATLSSIDPERDGELFETGASINYGAYSNESIDKLFRLGASATAPDERAKIYSDIHRLIYLDQPAAYLFHEPSIYGVGKRIEGIDFDERFGPYMFYPGALKWWVPARK